jgi:hypothetical protein
MTHQIFSYKLFSCDCTLNEDGMCNIYLIAIVAYELFGSCRIIFADLNSPDSN